MVTNMTDPLFTNIDMLELVVRDQQEALEWYTGKLGFEVRYDDPLPDGRGRWVTVGIPGQDDLMVVLEPMEWGPSGTPEEKESVIGHNSFSLQTDDVHETVETLRERGVEVVNEPEPAPWGTFALIADLYGNTLHLLEPGAPEAGD